MEVKLNKGHVAVAILWAVILVFLLIGVLAGLQALAAFIMYLLIGFCLVYFTCATYSLFSDS